LKIYIIGRSDNMMLGFGNIINKNSLKPLQDIIIADCESITDFDYIYSCTKALDTVKKVAGNSSIEFTKNGAVAGYFTMDITRSLNLSRYTSLKYSLYTLDKSNIASISSTLFTTSPYDYGHSYVYFVGWEIVNGWNTFTIPFSSFTKTGIEDLSSIKAIRFTVNLLVDNITEKINFDDIQILK